MAILVQIYCHGDSQSDTAAVSTTVYYCLLVLCLYRCPGCVALLIQTICLFQCREFMRWYNTD